eukprot:TRINITY_DN57347_c0_g1_i1.p1 TRINITY_DN57347_c0_g1~~TRINITY_DN57347_c0_g1_i1.p1  ORF type:complete len:310 (+),score=38.93 TRINITY_DN57347_c0_g1_i1:77-1006(+)
MESPRLAPSEDDSPKTPPPECPQMKWSCPQGADAEKALGSRPPLEPMQTVEAPLEPVDFRGGSLQSRIPQPPVLLHSPESALDLVNLVYTGSCGLGSDLAMDEVRGLHPHWAEVGTDSEIGKKVSWVRDTNDWVYGEVMTDSFLHILCTHLAPETQAKKTFVDLGSGTGKAVALASLHFAEAVGLELQEKLHQAAGGLSANFVLRAVEFGMQLGKIDLVQADFLGVLTPEWKDAAGQPWWEVATAVFATSPKFCASTMRGIARRAAMMRTGARIATVRHTLEDPALEEIWRGEGIFSWGADTVIVYRRM